MRNLQEKIAAIISNIRLDYEKKYIHTIVDVDFVFDQKNNRLDLSGNVLLARQVDEILSAIKVFHKGKIRNSINVVSEWNSISGLLEAAGLKKLDEKVPVNLYRIPAKNFSKYTRRRREKLLMNQLGFLPFRVLREYPYWLLIQVVDGTLGWARAARLNKRRLIAVDPKMFISRIKRDFFSTNDKKILAQNFEKICMKYTRAGYLLGGNSAGALDCSALTQRIIFQCFAILLPKKSADQRKIFINKKSHLNLHPDFFSEMELEKYMEFVKLAGFGELIFLKKKGKVARDHVGVWIDRDRGMILHSCLKKKGVVVEHFDQIKKDYELW